ncbi:hypothetical protein ABZT49_14255 [Methylobacterium sp. EM32]|uniref:hypothetical protein n=1 Tax=Methylobacterium sp. EM32 TaxID=3163481 RepID=UPI0033A05C8B
MRLRSLVISALTMGLAAGGCSIHPLPQDVTGSDTYEIVQKFRCEVRSAVLIRLTRGIIRYEGEERARDIFQGIGNGRIKWADIRKHLKSRFLLDAIDRYSGSTILYDFSLTMAEKNIMSGGPTLTRPFTRGSDTIGISLSTDNERQNLRTFTIRDSFEKVIIDLEQDCPQAPPPQNFDYPIAGSTRIEETIKTFLDLNESGNLSIKAGIETPTLSDELLFTTKKGATINPGFTYTPIGRIFEISALAGKFDVNREDIHKVTLVLALPKPGSKPTPPTIAETLLAAEQRLALSKQSSVDLSLQRIGDRLR